MDHILLGFGQVAGEAAGTDHMFEFFGGMTAAPVFRSDPHQARDGGGRTFHEINEERRDAVEDHQAGRQNHCQPVCPVDRDVLGHNLTDHHVGKSHDRE